MKAGLPLSFLNRVISYFSFIHFMAKRAIVRPPGRSYCNCISSHPEHSRLDLDLALVQHQEYVRTLSELGLEVIELSPRDDLPDACFVEDTVVVHQ